MKSHAIHNYEDLLNLMAVTTLETLEKKVAASKPRKLEYSGRAPTPAGKNYLLKKAENRCEFIDKTGKRCECANYLEADHIKPYAKGGKTELTNLRILCRNHNQRRNFI